MKTPHLASALVALSLAAALVGAGVLAAQAAERRAVYSLAPALLPQKVVGSALAAEALRHPDLLLLYGSSEVKSGGAARAGEFFRNAPTGFAVFVVGDAGMTSLLYLQQLAGLGAELQGRKVVISFTPEQLLTLGVTPREYIGHFSQLHARELVFSPDLSFALKQDAARRMLAFPSTVQADPVLRFALQQLAAGSLPGRALYLAALPLGELQLLILRLQDHWEAFWMAPTLRDDPAPAAERPRAAPDWPKLLDQAEQLQKRQADRNPFGFGEGAWRFLERRAAKEKGTVDPRESDRDFLASLAQSTEWTDLELLLRGLSELGAQPLLLSTPLHGAYYDAIGVSLEARRAYYTRLRDLASRYGVLARDYEDHDADRYFTEDLWSHPSQKGWLAFDQAIDAFYHGAALP